MSSVRRQLLVGLLALVAIVDGLAGFLSYRRALESTSALLDYQLQQMALSLRDQGAAAPDIRIPAQDRTFDFAIQIWDKDGVLTYASRVRLGLAHEPPPGYGDLTIRDERWRGFALQTPRRLILVAQPWNVREELAGRSALHATAPLLVLTPLLALAIWWMVSRTLGPIKRVVAEVQNRDAESLAPLMSSKLPEEIEPLISELNRLLERLAATFQAQRAFIADAAHELRSPLTALRVQLQLLGRAADAQEHAQALDKLNEAMDRAGGLVQQLLILARSEVASPSVPLAPVALDLIVRDVLAESASLAFARGSDLTLDAEAGIGIVGDPESLRILFRNLVDNALRYTPRDGRVWVKLRDTGKAVQFEIEDSGPGISVGERARVFDRFYRGVGAVEGGSGLGLAIVKAIAARHHATVELANANLGGLKVTVTFVEPHD